jgi:hypothetical protein
MNHMTELDDNLAPLLQAHIHLQANPDRVDCPVLETLEAFFQGCLEEDATEGLYDHLSHCRECLLELKSLRDMAREEAQDTGDIERESLMWVKPDADLSSCDNQVPALARSSLSGSYGLFPESEAADELVEETETVEV